MPHDAQNFGRMSFGAGPLSSQPPYAREYRDRACMVNPAQLLKFRTLDDRHFSVTYVR